MQNFAEAWPQWEFVQAPLAQLSWYHHQVLLDKPPSGLGHVARPAILMRLRSSRRAVDGMYPTSRSYPEIQSPESVRISVSSWLIAWKTARAMVTVSVSSSADEAWCGCDQEQRCSRGSSGPPTMAMMPVSQLVRCEIWRAACSLH